METNKIISDSSPLINLAKIDKLELLENLFGKIIIPSAVYNEVINDSQQKNGSAEIIELIENKIVQIKQVDNINLVKALRRDLDYGEAEVIALALEIDADLVLIDETDARRVAETYSLKMTGFIGILIKAYHKGLITNFKYTLDLAIKRGFWINRNFYKSILNNMKIHP